MIFITMSCSLIALFTFKTVGFCACCSPQLSAVFPNLFVELSSELSVSRLGTGEGVGWCCCWGECGGVVAGEPSAGERGVELPWRPVLNC